jgi:hypothetical protein
LQQTQQRADELEQQSHSLKTKLMEVEREMKQWESSALMKHADLSAQSGLLDEERAKRREMEKLYDETKVRWRSSSMCQVV